jgi:hypothetical protein
VDACNPPTASAPDLGAGRTRRPRDFHLSHARLRPPRLSPFRARSRARPIWAGARSTLTRRLWDPPVSKRRHLWSVEHDQVLEQQHHCGSTIGPVGWMAACSQISSRVPRGIRCGGGRGVKAPGGRRRR